MCGVWAGAGCGAVRARSAAAAWMAEARAAARRASSAVVITLPVRVCCRRTGRVVGAGEDMGRVSGTGSGCVATRVVCRVRVCGRVGVPVRVCVRD